MKYEGWKKTKNKLGVREKEDWLKVAGLCLLAVTPIIKSIFHSKTTFSPGGFTFPLKLYHYLNTTFHCGIDVFCVSFQNHLLSALFPQNLLSADGKRNSRSC